MSPHSAPGETDKSTQTTGHWTILAIRGTFGGILMGLANLVPGISGGTMLLAAGIYPRMIAAIAEISTFRFRLSSLVVLGSVLVAAAAGILLFAGLIKNLVIEHRWVMYSVFIGLTLGGLPVVWRMARPANRSVWAGALAGFLVMVLLALGQQSETVGGAGGRGYVTYLVAGLVGATAMILPGVSGGYLLLVLGVYLPILAAIDACKDALGAGAVGQAIDPALNVLLPVGIGVLTGIVAVSHLLKWCLARFEKATLGVLIGLLVGAVVGLWPFQAAVNPVAGVTVIKGRVVTAESLPSIPPEDFPTARFSPTAGQVAGALGLIAAGALTTIGISRVGGRDDSEAGG